MTRIPKTIKLIDPVVAEPSDGGLSLHLPTGTVLTVNDVDRADTSVGIWDDTWYCTTADGQDVTIPHDLFESEFEPSCGPDDPETYHVGNAVFGW